MLRHRDWRFLRLVLRRGMALLGAPSLGSRQGIYYVEGYPFMACDLLVCLRDLVLRRGMALLGAPSLGSRQGIDYVEGYPSWPVIPWFAYGNLC